MPRLALLSVSDKSDLVPFARALVARGFALLSTGGTRRALLDAGLDVLAVSDHTGAPEIFGGRVKTLHPRVHGGILGRRGLDDADAAAADIPWIDVVVVNLYPFEATVAAGAAVPEAVEQIDIGGPAMVRAAAKNHDSVWIVVDPSDYDAVLEGLDADAATALATRRRLAVRAFQHTSTYDAIVARWLSPRLGGDAWPAETTIPLRRAQTLRYGENPHQSAAFYVAPDERGRTLGAAVQLQGKELSFNNLADLDAAVRAAFDLESPGVVIVKHNNPCGAATHPSDLAVAYDLALSADPVSAYGGIVAFNRPLTGEVARRLVRSKVFYEVVAAPGIDVEARAALAGKANLRLMELPADWQGQSAAGADARRVAGGYLLQSWDGHVEPERRAVGRAPSPDEAAALDFAWRVCRNVKSNAIVLARAEADGALVLNGVGAGQMNRVDAVRLAITRATRAVAGSVLASDAFFPFADGVEAAIAAGVGAIVQPGGSIRDEEVFAVARAADVAMVLTGVRHFRH